MAFNNTNKSSSKTKIYIVMGLVIAAFLTHIVINIFFEHLTNKIEDKSHNLENKLAILNNTKKDIYLLETAIYKIPIFKQSRWNIDLLKKYISQLQKDILTNLNVLQNGGSLKLKTQLSNSTDELNISKTINYHNPNDISTIAIEIIPKIIKIDKITKQIIEFANSRSTNNAEDSNIQHLKSIYKTLPGFFLRIENSINNSIYNSSKALNKMQKNILHTKHQYVITQLVFLLIILVLMLAIVFKILSDIIQNENHLASLNKQLKSSQEDIKNILNAQSNIVAITDGSHLIFYNHALIDLIPQAQDIEKFNKDHGCICDFFEKDIPDGSYIYNRDYDGLNWVEYILANPNKNFRVIIKKDGEKHYLTVKAKRLEIFGKTTSVAITLSDITEEIKIQKMLLQQKRELHYQANYDTLTSLPNRTLMLDRLKYIIKNAERNRYKFAILFIDLDNFKEINDSMGHDLGDLVLKTAARRLTSLIRKEDAVARLGGDEFVIILNNINSIDDIYKVADKIIKSMSKPYIIDNYTLYAGSSVGISVYPDDGENINDLIKYADSAMYSAKNSGKNQFKYYDSNMTEDAHMKVLLEANLKKAIQNKEFVVYFQPQFDGSNGEIIGAEALIRWIHPQKGLISPGVFIPFAEASGLIDQIDKIVRDIAIDQFVRWKSQDLNPGSLSLNLSLKEVKNQNFVSNVKKLFDSKKIDPNWIEFEILERDIMSDPESTIEKLNAIKELGCKISLDDFGVEYSSLSFLQKLPISKIKIDMSFIKNIPQDKQISAIVKTIINFGKNIDVNLLAEGVEKEEQRDFLLQNGCKYIQGYLYSKPLSTKEFENLLKEKAQSKHA